MRTIFFVPASCFLLCACSTPALVIRDGGNDLSSPDGMVTVDHLPSDALSQDDTFVTTDVPDERPLCSPLAIEPTTLRIATTRGAVLRALGGAGRGALFTIAPGAMTGGATLTPGGGLLAGTQAATFEVLASDLMCNLTARARVDVVGPFVVEPTTVRIPPGRTMRFSATGAIETVRWEILQYPTTMTAPGVGTLDAMGQFTSGTIPGIYRIRASDGGSGNEIQATITVRAGTTFEPAAATILVPRGQSVPLVWRGG
jgi:hypothetical protein